MHVTQFVAVEGAGACINPEVRLQQHASKSLRQHAPASARARTPLHHLSYTERL